MGSNPTSSTLTNKKRMCKTNNYVLHILFCYYQTVQFLLPDCAIFTTWLYNICISNRSKLWVERTKKSLARNSRVLSDLRYIVDTQRVITSRTKVGKILIQKKRPFHRKRTTFALHSGLLYNAIGASLLSKCSPFVSVSAMQPCPYFFISLPLLRE